MSDTLKGRRLVSHLVSGKVYSLPGSASVLEAARLMQECRIGALLIVEEGRLRGIFSERDALCRVVAASRDPGLTPLSGVMTPNPQTSYPNMTAVEALRTMRDGGFRHLPVVEEGVVKGIVSMRDFVGAEYQEVDEQLQYATG